MENHILYRHSLGFTPNTDCRQHPRQTVQMRHHSSQRKVMLRLRRSQRSQRRQRVSPRANKRPHQLRSSNNRQPSSQRNSKPKREKEVRIIKHRTNHRRKEALRLQVPVVTFPRSSRRTASAISESVRLWSANRTPTLRNCTSRRLTWVSLRVAFARLCRVCSSS